MPQVQFKESKTVKFSTLVFYLHPSMVAFVTKFGENVFQCSLFKFRKLQKYCVISDVWENLSVKLCIPISCRYVTRPRGYSLSASYQSRSAERLNSGVFSCRFKTGSEGDIVTRSHGIVMPRGVVLAQHDAICRKTPHGEEPTGQRKSCTWTNFLTH